MSVTPNERAEQSHVELRHCRDELRRLQESVRILMRKSLTLQEEAPRHNVSGDFVSLRGRLPPRTVPLGVLHAVRMAETAAILLLRLESGMEDSSAPVSLTRQNEESQFKYEVEVPKLRGSIGFANSLQADHLLQPRNKQLSPLAQAPAMSTTIKGSQLAFV